MTTEDVAEAIMALKRSGWSIGDAAFVGVPVVLIWVVSGRSLWTQRIGPPPRGPATGPRLFSIRLESRNQITDDAG